VAEHRRGPGERAGQVADDQRRGERGREALRNVEQRHGEAEPEDAATMKASVSISD
jgi:hypothetical protein